MFFEGLQCYSTFKLYLNIRTLEQFVNIASVGRRDAEQATIVPGRRPGCQAGGRSRAGNRSHNRSPRVAWNAEARPSSSVGRPMADVRHFDMIRSVYRGTPTANCLATQ